MLPDRWNPRLRLRNWLLKPAPGERAGLESLIGAEALVVLKREQAPGGLLDRGYRFEAAVRINAQAPSVRRMRVSELLGEELADSCAFLRAQSEGNPAESFVAQPDANPTVGEGSENV